MVDMDLVGRVEHEWHVLVSATVEYQSRPDLDMKGCENVTSCRLSTHCHLLGWELVGGMVVDAVVED